MDSIFNKKFLHGIDSLSRLTLSAVLSGAMALGGLSSADALGFGDVTQGEHSQTYDLSLDSKANSFDVKVPQSYRAEITMEMRSAAGTQSKQGYGAGFYRIEVADSAIAGGIPKNIGTSQQVAVTPPPIFNKSPKDSSLAPTPTPYNDRSQPTPPKTTPSPQQDQQVSASGKSLSYDTLYQKTTTVIFGPGPVSLDTSKWPSRYYGILRFRESGPIPEGAKKESCNLSINYPAEERRRDGGYTGGKYGPICNLERSAKGIIELTTYDRSLPRLPCGRICKQDNPPSVTSKPNFAGSDARNNTPITIHNASFWKEGYHQLGGTIFPVRRRGQGGF